MRLVCLRSLCRPQVLGSWRVDETNSVRDLLVERSQSANRTVDSEVPAGRSSEAGFRIVRRGNRELSPGRYQLRVAVPSAALRRAAGRFKR